MTATATIAAHPRTSPAHRVAAFVSARMADLANWAERRAKAAEVANELQSYTDRELADLGISRFEIARIAAEAGEMKRRAR